MNKYGYIKRPSKRRIKARFRLKKAVPYVYISEHNLWAWLKQQPTRYHFIGDYIMRADAP